ncbi:DUF305 domain-containing protein [Jiangella aurantiaca]|uniref:DUF305 domain-containing protein n=1 Tax=Jiangella aurantiaca TaxID=2530373 RepID=A0A4R5AF09_9ACTN|nr:DUF305 domain-containing protein [Jiangella aurantiaca]TDD69916.1 DUF305 domain-containing protein [Jiangella aurantiaca]
MSLDLDEPALTAPVGRRLPGRLAGLCVAAALVVPGVWVATAGSGHDAHVAPAPGAATAQAGDVPTAADICFVRMMIPHHEQAVAMSDLLLAKSGVWERGRRYAEFVRAAQAREVEMMRRWLDAWGSVAHGGHGAGTPGCGHTGPMPGMLPAGRIEALRVADGPAAQLLYLRLMIPHHEGAVEMAYDEIAAGSNVYAVSVAKHVVQDQLGEVAAMESMLAELSAAP